MTSIKGRYSVINLRKMVHNNPTLDVSNINMCLQNGQMLSICSQDIEQKGISGNQSRAVSLLQICEISHITIKI